MAANADLFSNRLLAIDDEPGVGRIVMRVAHSVGFEVVTTQDPHVFIKTARQWHPTVVVLDLNMPGTDGIELLRILAADRCPAHIIVSSGADTKVLETARQLGQSRGLKMGRVLQKPVRLDDFRNLLREFNPMPAGHLADQLADAIRSNQLILEYQPQLDCRLGTITGVEALVRWQHPQQGLVPPNQFVPLAEQRGLIRDLTDWVVRQAANQAALWRAEGLDLTVAVNISASDLEDMALPERLHEHCRRAGLDPAALTLELTETGAMREPTQMMDVLARLRLKNFGLSVDDFGTGYSCLAQLQRMPFCEIKIDASFVLGMVSSDGCRIIVEIVIDLARKLGLRSVAEGVEQETALKRLIDLGCDAAQGYFISRPLPADKVGGFVRAYNEAAARSAAATLQAAS